MQAFHLNYTSIGAGIPIIFQHGLGANLSQAQGLMAGFDGFQTISMDCPGHGKSALKEGYQPSFEAYTQEVLRLMDQLEIESAIFGGISMGSGISLKMALHYPDRVKGLILVRPAWLAEGRPANLEILLDIIPYLKKPNGKEEFEQLAEFQAIKAVNQNAATSVLGQFTRDQGDTTPDVLRGITLDAPFSDLAELEKIQHPAILFANDQDPLHPMEMGEIIANKLPNCQYHQVISKYEDAQKHKEEVRRIASGFLSQF